MAPSRGAVVAWLRRVGPWAGLAFLAGLGAVAGSYAEVGRTPAFVAAPVAVPVSRSRSRPPSPPVTRPSHGFDAGCSARSGPSRPSA